jgi:hypothetical protein
MSVRLSDLCIGRPLPARKIPDIHFSQRLSRPQGHSTAGRIRWIEKIHLIGARTRELRACSIVPEPATLPRDPELWHDNGEFTIPYNPLPSTHFLVHHSPSPFHSQLLQLEQSRRKKTKESRYEYYTVGFQVLTAVFMKCSAFWNIIPCSPLKVNWRFGRTYHLHLQKSTRCSKLSLPGLFFGSGDGRSMILRNVPEGTILWRWLFHHDYCARWMQQVMTRKENETPPATKEWGRR